MIISDTIQITVADLVQQPDIVDRSLAAMPVNDPAREAMRAYAGDLLAMPGAQFVSWARTAPGHLKVQFSDTGHRHLADAVLRDTIAGATLVLKADPRPDAPLPAAATTPKQPFWESTSNMIRAVKSMRGIYQSDVSTEHGFRAVSFRAIDQSVADHVRPLINEYLGSFKTSFYAPKLP